MRDPDKITRTALVGLLLFAVMAKARSDSLFDLDLEQLGRIKITSLSKKEESVFDASAAVTVVTQDDIRRLGAANIPEALRFVPGLQVARVDGNKWAITARGFSSLFANKLLVLIDGRSVYNPIFSGAWWDAQDTLLEDIDRIEVIRGPGATLWGANAVNGIINIITQHARDTSGGLLSAAAGTEERGIAGGRYGGRLGEEGYYRIYGKYLNRDDLQGAGDETEAGRGGFRIDQNFGPRASLMLQAEGYRGSSDGARTSIASLSPPFNAFLHNDMEPSGAHLLGRWTHRTAGNSLAMLQFFYDYTDRDFQTLGFTARSDVVDLEAQHEVAVGERHDIVWGGGYRLARSTFDNGFPLGMSPDERNDQVFNLFAQDTITLVPERWRLTLGSKFEHNDITGFEVQPNIRLAWTPDDDHTFWGSIGRAVRVPGIVAVDGLVNLRVQPPAPGMPLPTVFGFRGNTDHEAEELLAYELGYRARLNPRFYWDLALFYHDFDELQGLLATPCGLERNAQPPRVLCPQIFNNGIEGEAYGVELSADWRVGATWRLQGGYTFTRKDTRAVITGTVVSATPEGVDPEHQIFLRSSLDLPRNLSFDMGLRYVDDLPAFALSSYFTVDARLGWRPSKQWELALVGKNLVEDAHPEYGPQVFFDATEVERSVLGTVTLSF